MGAVITTGVSRFHRKSENPEERFVDGSVDLVYREVIRIKVNMEFPKPQRPPMGKFPEKP